MDDDLRNAMVQLVEVYYLRDDLQLAFPESQSKDFRRLLEWVNGVVQKKWEDTYYNILKPYEKQFESLLSLGEIQDPSIDKWSNHFRARPRLQYPPGHFYSPVLSEEEVKKRKDFIYRESHPEQSLDFFKEDQKILLQEFAAYVENFPYLHEGLVEARYKLQNGWFENSDGYILFCFLKKFKPNRIIEIGSGYSSALMLDMKDYLFDGKLDITFIEPNPMDRLSKIVRKTDYESGLKIIEQEVQNVSVDWFRSLEENDFLFIDSSHVSKPGSDLNYLLFDVIPNLDSGVLIHFHDIFYPFEYPEYWLTNWKGFGWNEIYLVRAFLMNNDSYAITFFSDYMEKTHRQYYEQNLPFCLMKNESGNSGQSLWIKKMK